MTFLCLTGMEDGQEEYYAPARQEIMIIEEAVEAAAISDIVVATPATPDHSNRTAVIVEDVTSVWERLAVCESGMNGVPRWDYNGSSGFDGGIQFHPRTWTEFKDSSDPSYAHQATPQRQVEIGRRVAKVQGAGAWPSCTSKLGISTSDLLN